MTWNDFLTEAGTILGLAKKGLDKSMEIPPANVTVLATAQLDSLQADLTAQRELVITLKATLAEKESAITALRTELSNSKNELDDAKSSIETKASQRAAEIVATVGQPPIPTTPTAAPASATKPTSELKGFAKVVAAFREEAQAK